MTTLPVLTIDSAKFWPLTTWARRTFGVAPTTACTWINRGVIPADVIHQDETGKWWVQVEYAAGFVPPSVRSGVGRQIGGE